MISEEGIDLIPESSHAELLSRGAAGAGSQVPYGDFKQWKEQFFSNWLIPGLQQRIDRFQHSHPRHRKWFSGVIKNIVLGWRGMHSIIIDMHGTDIVWVEAE